MVGTIQSIALPTNSKKYSLIKFITQQCKQSSHCLRENIPKEKEIVYRLFMRVVLSEGIPVKPNIQSKCVHYT